MDTGGKPILHEAHLNAVIEVSRKAGIFLLNGGAVCGREKDLADDDAFYASLVRQFLPAGDVEKLVKQIFRGYADFEKSVEAYWRVKKELLELSLKTQ